MKKMLFCILGILVMVKAAGAAQVVEADATITAVTVYQDRALVTRSVLLDLEPGSYEVVFSHLPGAILHDSLRSSGKGTATAWLLGLETKKVFLEKTPQDKVRRLEEKLQNLKDEDRAITDKLEAVKSQWEFLQSIKVYSADQFSKEMVTREPKAEEWKAILEFLGNGFKETAAEKRKLEIERRELKDKTRVAEKELNEIRSGRRLEEKSVTVALEVKEAGTLNLDLFYVVPGASWRPLYDARAFEATKEVELTYYGQVRQRTGEDWKDVRLTLSTAKPAIGARMPEIRPWYLRPSQTRSVLKLGRSRLREEAGKRDYNDAIIAASGQLAEGKISEAREVPALPVEVGTSVNFAIQRRESIPADNQPHKTTISRETLPAEFEYIATPKLSPYAYLKASLTNKEDYPFLAGRVNVFLGENFVGTSRLDTIASQEKFALHLGIDEGIKVKREEIKGKTGVSFLRTKIQKRYAYRIEVENYKKKAEKITVIDQIPVSRDERIKVKLVNLSEEPAEETERGILKWKFELESEGKKTIEFEFLVEYPKDMRVPGI